MFNIYEQSNVKSQTQVSLDAGLRSYMLKVYNLMCSAILVTAFTSLMLSSSQELMQTIFSTNLVWVFIFAPFVLVLFFAPILNRVSSTAGVFLLILYSALMGISLSSIFLVYTGQSIAKVFFITSATFGATSLYGYVTKRDLTKLGSFLMMGLIGFIIASLVNLFLHSSAFDYLLSFLGVILFIGLTAYDTQQIKDDYYLAGANTSTTKLAIMGALKLYLDFLNLFIMLLRLFGSRE